MPPRKTNKRPKDLNAPKRPPSAYLLFNSNRQKSLKEQHPGKKLTELTKLVGAEWKTLTAEDREPFDRQAGVLKEKYKTDLEEYKASDLYSAYQSKLEKWKARQGGGESGSDDDDDEEPVPAKRPKDPNAPKKPLSAFFIFQTNRRQELKAEHPDKKNTEFSKMAGAEWKAMDPTDKLPFEEKAKVKKADYVTALAAYKQTEEYEQYQAKVKAWQDAKKRQAAAKKNKKKKKPPTPPPSSNSSSGEDDDDSEESSDEDGDTNMQSRRRASSTDDDEEQYSSDSDD